MQAPASAGANTPASGEDGQQLHTLSLREGNTIADSIMKKTERILAMGLSWFKTSFKNYQKEQQNAQILVNPEVLATLASQMGALGPSLGTTVGAVDQGAIAINGGHATTLINKAEPGGAPISQTGSNATMNYFHFVLPVGAKYIAAEQMVPVEPLAVVNGFPAPQNSPEIYRSALMRHNVGYPLWIPAPNTQLPVAYRASGVCIGDVGTITPEGGFSFLFNTCREATDPINASRSIPPDFRPFPLPKEGGAIDRFREFDAGCSLSSSSVSRTDPENATLKTVFTTSAAKAAVLMMPESVYTEKFQQKGRLTIYVQKNLRTWYQYFKTELGLDIENGDLRVVYASRKSSAYGMTAIDNDSMDPITKLTFSVDDSRAATFDCKYKWQSHQGCAESKAGPLLADKQALISEPNAGAVGNPINQCLFISTIDEKLSDKEWLLIQSGGQVAIPDQSAGSATMSPSPASPSALGRGDGSSGSSSSAHHGGLTYSMALHLRSSLDLNTAQCQTRLAAQGRPFNPSDILTDYLLWTNPDATSVAVCTDDWGPYMTERVEDASTLINNILAENDVRNINGMMYLARKEHKLYKAVAIQGKVTVTFDKQYGYVRVSLLQRQFETLLHQSPISAVSRLTDDPPEAKAADVIRIISPDGLTSMERLGQSKETNSASVEESQPPSNPYRSKDIDPSPPRNSSKSNKTLTSDPQSLDVALTRHTKPRSSPSSPAFSPQQMMFSKSAPPESRSKSLDARERPRRSSLNPSLIPDHRTRISEPENSESAAYPREPTAKDPHQLFLEAAKLPLENAGPFLPQQMYKPRSGRTRSAEDPFKKPLYFTTDTQPKQFGILLMDAIDSRTQQLANHDQVVFAGSGPSVSIRIEWPGYRSWSEQIPSKPITLAKLAKRIAKCVARFIQTHKNRPMNERSSGSSGSSEQLNFEDWRFGDGPNDIKLDDLILVSLHHVSLTSWQPQLRLARPRTPR